MRSIIRHGVPWVASGPTFASCALALVLTLTACHGSSKPDASSTGPGPSATGSATTTAGTSSTSATAAKSTTPVPSSSTSLGGDCATVLPVLTVDRAVGTTVVGATAFVVDQPNYAVGQVERVNCQYGLVTPKGKTTSSAPKVEVSVSLYDTSAHATARVASTEETWREHGAAPHAVSVRGHAGVVLVGYGAPLLVLGVGARTVVVSTAPTLVTAARRDAVLVALAGSALSGSGG